MPRTVSGFFSLLILLSAAKLGLAYRMVSLDEGVPVDVPTFRPYSQGGAASQQGRVGLEYTGEPQENGLPSSINTINPGNPFSEGSQPDPFRGVLPRMDCPGMIGPFNDTGSGLYAYYCSAKRAGYCDRRSGVCFCNTGYMGEDCAKCAPTHVRKEGTGECVARTVCPNDCSGGGTCNAETGICICDKGRRGMDCSLQLCLLYDRWCTSCDDFTCRQCASGYFLDTVYSSALQQNVTFCQSCTIHDVNCHECNRDMCLVCTDSTLQGTFRSSRRTEDPLLSPWQNAAFEVPLGSQDVHEPFTSINTFTRVDEYRDMRQLQGQVETWTLGEACASLLRLPEDGLSRVNGFAGRPTSLAFTYASGEDIYSRRMRRMAVDCALRPLNTTVSINASHMLVPSPRLLTDIDNTIRYLASPTPASSADISAKLGIAVPALILAVDAIRSNGRLNEAELVRIGARTAKRIDDYVLPSRGAIPGSPVQLATLYAPALAWDTGIESNDGEAGAPLNTFVYGDIYQAALNSSTSVMTAKGLGVPTDFARKYKHKAGQLASDTKDIELFSRPTTIVTQTSAARQLADTIVDLIARADNATSVLQGLLTVSPQEMRAALEVLLRPSNITIRTSPLCPYGVCLTPLPTISLSSSDVKVYMHRGDESVKPTLLLNASTFSCTRGTSKQTQFSRGIIDNIRTNASWVQPSYPGNAARRDVAATWNTCFPSFPAAQNGVFSATADDLDVWRCKRETTPHVYCGSDGFVEFGAPKYVVYENAQALEVLVTRSGGGMSRASVRIALRHIDTDDSDASLEQLLDDPTLIVFEPGVVKLSFIIRIHDDTVPEGRGGSLSRHTALLTDGTIRNRCAFEACPYGNVTYSFGLCSATVRYTAPVFGSPVDPFLRVNTAVVNESAVWRDLLGPHEAFQLVLHNPCCGMQLGRHSTTTVAILDDDADRVAQNTEISGAFMLRLPEDVLPLTSPQSVSKTTPSSFYNTSGAISAMQTLLNQRGAGYVSLAHELALLVATMPAPVAGITSVASVLPKDFRGQTVNETRLTHMFTATPGAPGNGTLLVHVLGTERFFVRLQSVDAAAVFGMPKTVKNGNPPAPTQARPGAARSNTPRTSVATPQRLASADSLYYSLNDATKSSARIPYGANFFASSYDATTRTYRIPISTNTAGIHRVDAYRAVPGGLLATYYDQAGTPIRTRVEPQIVHRWGYEPLLVAGECNTTVCPPRHDLVKGTVVWEGAVLSPQSVAAGTTLFMLATQPVRVWINEIPVLDTWGDKSQMGAATGTLSAPGVGKPEGFGPGSAPSQIRLPTKSTTSSRTVCTFGGFGSRMPSRSRMLTDDALLDSSKTTYISNSITCVDASALFSNDSIAADEVGYFASSADIVSGATNPLFHGETARSMSIAAAVANAWQESGVISSASKANVAVQLPMTLLAGQMYHIRVEYQRKAGFAVCELLWRNATTSSAAGNATLTVVPTDHLFYLERISVHREPLATAGQQLAPYLQPTTPSAQLVPPEGTWFTYVQPSSVAAEGDVFNENSRNSRINVTSIAINPVHGVCSPSMCTPACKHVLRHAGVLHGRVSSCNSPPLSKQLANAGIASTAFGAVTQGGIPGERAHMSILPRDRLGNFRGVLGALDVFLVFPVSILLLPQVRVRTLSTKTACGSASVGYGNLTVYEVEFQRRSSAIQPVAGAGVRGEFNINDTTGIIRRSAHTELTFNASSSLYDATWVTTTSGVYAISVTLANLTTNISRHVAGSPFVTLINQAAIAAIDPVNSVIDGNGVHPTGAGVVAGGPYTIFVTPYDSFGNVILQSNKDLSQSLKVRATVRHTIYNNVSYLVDLVPTYVSLGTGNNAAVNAATSRFRVHSSVNTWYRNETQPLQAGVAELALSHVSSLQVPIFTSSYVPTVSGFHTVHVTLGNQQIANSPFIVRVAPGPTSPQQSVVTYEPVWTEDSIPLATLTIKDAFGNVRLESEGAEVSPADDDVQITVSFTVEGPYGPVTSQVAGTNAYLGNATYELRLPCLALVCNVSVTAKGQQVKGSPFQFRRIAGPPVAGQSHVWGPGAFAAQAGWATWAILQTRDANGNARLDPTPPLSFATGSTNVTRNVTAKSTSSLSVDFGDVVVSSRVEAWMVQIDALATDGAELLMTPADEVCTRYGPAVNSYSFLTMTGSVRQLPSAVREALPTTVSSALLSSLFVVPRWYPADFSQLLAHSIPLPLINDSIGFTEGSVPPRWRIASNVTCNSAPCDTLLDIGINGSSALPLGADGDGFYPLDTTFNLTATALMRNFTANTLRTRAEVFQRASELGLPAFNVEVTSIVHGNGAILLSYKPLISGIYLLYVAIDGEMVLGAPFAVPVVPSYMSAERSNALISAAPLRYNRQDVVARVNPFISYSTTKMLRPINSLDGWADTILEETLTSSTQSLLTTADTSVDATTTGSTTANSNVWAAYIEKYGIDRGILDRYPRATSVTAPINNQLETTVAAGSVVLVDVIRRDEFGNRVLRRTAEGQQVRALWMTQSQQRLLIPLAPSCFTPGSMSGLIIPTTAGTHKISVYALPWAATSMTEYFTATQSGKDPMLFSREEPSINVEISGDTNIAPNKTEMFGYRNALRVIKKGIVRPIINSNASAFASDVDSFADTESQDTVLTESSSAADASVCTGKSEVVTWVFRLFNTVPYPSNQPFSTLGSLRFYLSAGNRYFMPDVEVSLQMNTQERSDNAGIATEWTLHVPMQSGCFYTYKLEYQDPLDVGAAFREAQQNVYFASATSERFEISRGVKVFLLSNNIHSDVKPTHKSATTAAVQAIPVPPAFLFPPQGTPVGAWDLLLRVLPGIPQPSRTRSTHLFNLLATLPTPPTTIHGLYDFAQGTQYNLQLFDRFGNVASNYYSADSGQTTAITDDFTAEWQSLQRCGVAVTGIRRYVTNSVDLTLPLLSQADGECLSDPINATMQIRLRFPTTGYYEYFVTLLPPLSALQAIEDVSGWARLVYSQSDAWRNLTEIRQKTWPVRTWQNALDKCDCLLPLNGVNGPLQTSAVVLPSFFFHADTHPRLLWLDTATLWTTTDDVVESALEPCTSCSPAVLHATHYSKGLRRAVVGEPLSVVVLLLDNSAPPLYTVKAADAIATVNTTVTTAPTSFPCAIQSGQTTSCIVSAATCSRSSASVCVNAENIVSAVPQRVLLPSHVSSILGTQAISVTVIPRISGDAEVQLLLSDVKQSSNRNIARPLKVWAEPSTASALTSTIKASNGTRTYTATNVLRNPALFGAGVVRDYVVIVPSQAAFTGLSNNHVTATEPCSSALPLCAPYHYSVHPSVISRLAYWAVVPTDTQSFLDSFSSITEAQFAAHFIERLIKEGVAPQNATTLAAVRSYLAGLPNVCGVCSQTDSCNTRVALTPQPLNSMQTSQPTYLMQLYDSEGNQRASSGASISFHYIAAAHSTSNLAPFKRSIRARRSFAVLDNMVGWKGQPGVARTLLTSECVPTGQQSRFGVDEYSGFKVHTGAISSFNALGGSVVRVWSVDNRNGSISVPIPSINVHAYSLSNNGDQVQLQTRCAALDTMAAAAVQLDRVSLLVDVTQLSVAHESTTITDEISSVALWNSAAFNQTHIHTVTRSCEEQAGDSSDADTCVVQPAIQSTITLVTSQLSPPRKVFIPALLHSLLPASPVGDGLVMRIFSAWEQITQATTSISPTVVQIVDNLAFDDLWSWRATTGEEGTSQIAAQGATFSGYIMTPTDALYTFVLECDDPCEVLLDDMVLFSFAPHKSSNASAGGIMRMEQSVGLRGPQLYRFTATALRFQASSTGVLRLSWRWDAGSLVPQENTFNAHSDTPCSWLAQPGEPSDCAYERKYFRASALQYRSQTELQLVPMEACFSDESVSPLLLNAAEPLLLQVSGSINSNPT